MSTTNLKLGILRGEILLSEYMDESKSELWLVIPENLTFFRSEMKSASSE